MKENSTLETQTTVVDGTTHTLVIENYTENGEDFYSMISLNGIAIDSVNEETLEDIVFANDWTTVTQ